MSHYPRLFSQVMLATWMFLAVSLGAQWPTANLYHFYVGPEGLKDPLMLTAFNREGYNNQPYFQNAQQVLLTSDHLSPGLPEIWLVDIEKESLKRLSRTDHQEFSPCIRPETREISAVRIEPDGKATQRFWVFDPMQVGPGAPVPPTLTGVGYYAWMNRDTAAFFLIGQPQLLILADLITGHTDTVARNPGRSLRFDPAGRLLFVHKVTSEGWFLKYYIPSSGDMGIITRTPHASEDFCLMPDGSILMASGSIIHRFRLEHGSWEPWADLSGYGLTQITRLATYDGTQLIVVNQLP